MPTDREQTEVVGGAKREQLDVLLDAILGHVGHEDYVACLDEIFANARAAKVVLNRD